MVSGGGVGGGVGVGGGWVGGGWGFGWGWGWPGLWWGPGFYGPYSYWGIGYDPYFDPLWNWSGYGYGSAPGYDVNYSNPPGSSSNYNPADNYNFNASNNLAPANQDQGYQDQGYQGAVNENPMTGNVAASTPTILIYLNDGTTYAASDYWLADGKLHYNVNYAGESAVNIEDVNLQRTVDENAKRGVHFTLKPAPNTYTPPPADDHGSNRMEQNPPAAPATTPGAPPPAPQLQKTSLRSSS